MHLQINANSFIQTWTTAGKLESRFLDATQFNDLLLTLLRPFSHGVPMAWDARRKVLLCILDHARCRNPPEGSLG